MKYKSIRLVAGIVLNNIFTLFIDNVYDPYPPDFSDSAYCDTALLIRLRNKYLTHHQAIIRDKV